LSGRKRGALLCRTTSDVPLEPTIIDSGTTSHIHSNCTDFISLKSSSSGSINGFRDGSRTIESHGEAQLLAQLPTSSPSCLKLQEYMPGARLYMDTHFRPSAEAVNYIVHTKNRHSTSALSNTTPHKVHFNKKPDISRLCPSSCKAYIYNHSPKHKKLSPLAYKGIVIGHAEGLSDIHTEEEDSYQHCACFL
jgi:hypothetical protein